MTMEQGFTIKDNRRIEHVMHASTQTVIRVLQELNIPAGEGFHALDIGTGSGILAMMIAGKWPNSKVLATDISKQAVQHATGNAAENGLASKITCIQADGLDHQKIREMAPYRLIIANVLAEVHIRYIASMAEMLAEDGIGIISGILAWRLQEVEQAIAYTPLTINVRVEHQGWITLVLGKDAHPKRL